MREPAIGVFITLEEPTRPMQEEAVSAGFYHSPGSGQDYPRIQILTIEELLHGAEVKIRHSTGPSRKPAGRGYRSQLKTSSVSDQETGADNLSAPVSCERHRTHPPLSNKVESCPTRTGAVLLVWP